MKFTNALALLSLLALTTALPLQGLQKRSAAPQDAAQFAEELADMNALQQQTTEEEFAQDLNDAAWKTASGAASDQIQKRQFVGSAETAFEQEQAEEAAALTQAQQIAAEEAAALANSQTTYQQTDSQASSDFSRSVKRQFVGSAETAYEQEQAQEAAALTQAQQIAAEEAAALANSQTSYQQADSQASSEFSK